jgi:hypothetical protein
MSKLNRYNDFYLKKMSQKQANKKKIAAEFKLDEFSSMIDEGKKHDIVTLHLKNDKKLNESYSIILENQEILSETKQAVCAEFYKDRINEISFQAKKYLQSKNISKRDKELIEEGFLRKIAVYIAGEENVKKAENWIEKQWNVLSDAAKQVWNSIIEDVMKPGLEALKNVATKLFGEDIVAAIETTAKRLINNFDQFLKTTKSVFDKAYDSLKKIAQNLVNIVKDVWAKVKEVLSAVWKFIKQHALSVIPGMKGKLSKSSKLGEKVNQSTLSTEMQKFGEDIKDMAAPFIGDLSKALGGGQNVVQSSGEKILATAGEKVEATNDSFIWDSLKGFMAKNSDFDTNELVKLHETKIEKIYEASQESEEKSSEEEIENDVHKHESRGIKKWLSSIVMWVLSPFAKLMEIIADVVAKGLMAIPAWLAGKLGSLLEGVKGLVKYAGTFVAMGTLVAFIVGAAAESFSLATHIPGKWIEEAAKGVGLEGAMHKAEEIAGDLGKGIEKSTGLNLADIKKEESRLHKFEEFNRINESAEAPKKGINWKGLAIGSGTALLAFLVSAFTHSIPGLHMGFEIISLVLLLIASIGYLVTETSLKDKFKDSVVGKIGKTFYNFVHPH